MIMVQDKHIAIKSATRHLFAYGVILVICVSLVVPQVFPRPPQVGEGGRRPG